MATSASAISLRNNINTDYGSVNIQDPRTQIPEGLPSLLNTWLRDPVITLGKNKEYILTGTNRLPGHPNASRWNDGLHGWRSYDLKNWEHLGLLWKLDNGPEWIRNFHVHDPKGGRILPPEVFYKQIPSKDIRVHRSHWSPRIMYSRKHKTYLASCCMNFNMGEKAENWIEPIFGGTFILKSLSGEVTGPYEITSLFPLTNYIDSRIFEDDDETLYFIWQDGRIARLADDLCSLKEYHDVWQTSYNPEPVKEGIHLFKFKNQYHLVLSIWSHEVNGNATYNHRGHGGKNALTYDAVIAVSDHIYGPYGARYTSITDGGHGNHFQDLEGNWWACVFHEKSKKDVTGSIEIRPRLVPMHWEADKIYCGRP